MSDNDNQLFLHPQPSGDLRLVWYLRDMHRYWTEDQNEKYIKSDIFTTPDDCKWRLYLLPNGESD